MRLLCRQTWSRLAGLAILAVIVLAACSSGPGVAAPTVKDGAGKVLAPTLSLKVDEKSKSVSLSGVFTGASLEYSAESNDKAVADTEVKDGTLTITAHKAGTATITVTAKNTGGSVKYEVNVTVTSKSSPERGAAPTVKADAPRTVEFEAGDTTETIPLISVFTGENLAYTVESNNSTVADGRIRNAVLTITVLSTGSATITVTATNAAGNIAHSITVTVPEPEPTTIPEQPTTGNLSSCKSPLIIELDDEPVPCTLPSNKHRFEVETGGVSANEDKSDPTGKTWLIAPYKKGPFRITIWDGTGKSAAPLTGEVPNSRPKRVSNDDGTLPEIPDRSLTGPFGPITAIDLTEIFEDPDDDDELSYRIASKPDWVLVKTENGLVVTGEDDASAIMTVDVMKKMDAGDSFQVTLQAVDPGGAESRVPAAIKFNTAAALDPRGITYTAEQQSKGELHKTNVLKVGPRREVDHTLKFDHPDDTMTFVFAESKNDTLEGRDLLPENTAPTATATDYYYRKPDGNYAPEKPPEYVETNPWSVGDSYFVLESFRAVEAKWPATPDNQVSFKLLNDKGSSGSIKITYCVVPAEEADSSDPATTASCTYKSLTVNVITCTSFPASATVDCHEATN